MAASFSLFFTTSLVLLLLMSRVSYLVRALFGSVSSYLLVIFLCCWFLFLLAFVDSPLLRCYCFSVFVIRCVWILTILFTWTSVFSFVFLLYFDLLCNCLVLFDSLVESNIFLFFEKKKPNQQPFLFLFLFFLKLLSDQHLLFYCWHQMIFVAIFCTWF